MATLLLEEPALHFEEVALLCKTVEEFYVAFENLDRDRTIARLTCRYEDELEQEDINDCISEALILVSRYWGRITKNPAHYFRTVLHRTIVAVCKAKRRETDTLVAMWQTQRRQRGGWRRGQDLVPTAIYLGKLSEQEERILRLYFCEKLTLKEIAEEIGISIRNVRRIIKEICEKLHTNIDNILFRNLHREGSEPTREEQFTARMFLFAAESIKNVDNHEDREVILRFLEFILDKRFTIIKSSPPGYEVRIDISDLF